MKEKVKFLIDESVDFAVVTHLKNCDYDVTSIVEDHPSLEDIEILKIAYKEKRILVTNDKDFGSLIFKENLQSHGLVFLRLKNQSCKEKIKVLDKLLEDYSDKLLCSFIVVTENKIRVRKL